MRIKTNIVADNNIPKVKKCIYFSYGNCKNGENCSFLHSITPVEALENKFGYLKIQLIFLLHTNWIILVNEKETFQWIPLRTIQKGKQKKICVPLGLMEFVNLALIVVIYILYIFNILFSCSKYLLISPICW